MHKKSIIIPLLALIALSMIFLPGQLASKPSVVMIIIDTLRSDKLGCYGFYEDISPELDTLAKNGVLFKNTLAQSSWTRPSIGSLLTGLYPRTLGIYREKFDIVADHFTLLSELLHEKGYGTYGITANPNINRFFNFAQGFDQYQDSHVIWRWMQPEQGKTAFAEKGVLYKKEFSSPQLLEQLHKAKVLFPTNNPLGLVRFNKQFVTEDSIRAAVKKQGIKASEEIVHLWKKAQRTNYPAPCTVLFEQALSYARQASKKQPHYMQINIMEMHNPWHLLRKKYNQNLLKLPPGAEALYHDTVRQVSADVQQFVTKIQAVPGWENTLFIITSDHGEGLKSHPAVSNSESHGTLLYKSQLKVPLIWYQGKPHSITGFLSNLFPRSTFTLPRGLTIKKPVRLLDLLPTLLDYLQLPIPENIPGVSLVNLLYQEGTAPELPPCFISEATYRGADKISAYSPTWEFIENRDNHPGLNRFELQPAAETENGKRTDKGAYNPEIRKRMQQVIKSWEKQYPKTPATEPATSPSTKEIKQLQALGYLN